jgi:copper resistance protein B
MPLLLALAAMPVHAQHEHHQPSPQPAPAPKPSPAPAPAPESPEPTAAERAAAFPDLGGMDMRDHMQEDPLIATLLVDQFEWRDAGDDAGLDWNLRGWIGKSNNRVWLRSEGERRDGSTADGNVELLWGRPTGPWWDAVVGVRHDFGEGPSRDWLALGVQGIAPYKFEIEATAYLGTSGRTAARIEADYELLLTNRLILQPVVEVNLHGRDDPQRGIGAGLSTAEAGLRLRYEFTRQFAPYIGVVHERAFGNTAELRRDEHEAVDDTLLVAGIRVWF